MAVTVPKGQIYAIYRPYYKPGHLNYIAWYIILPSMCEK